MSVMTEEKSNVLNAKDRCDRCGGQAYFWINGVAGDLMFCRHHFLKHEDKLRQYAFEIVDETYKINEISESSA
jgi:ribosomal protein S14